MEIWKYPYLVPKQVRNCNSIGHNRVLLVTLKLTIHVTIRGRVNLFVKGEFEMQNFEFH